MTIAYLGLGANLGERRGTLRAAVRGLERGGEIRLVGASSLYETEPIGPPQPPFLNACIAIETALAPRRLLDRCLAIEAELGRARQGTRDLPRTIDLDILLYGDEIIAEPKLVVPHARLHLRAFALVPLLELDPARVHPVLGRPLRDLLAEIPLSKAVRMIEEGRWLHVEQGPTSIT